MVIMVHIQYIVMRSLRNMMRGFFLVELEFMKRTLLLAVVSLFGVCSLFSQNLEEMRISYVFMYRDAQEQTLPSKKTYVLSLGDGQSYFYPQSNYGVTGRLIEDNSAFRVYKNFSDIGKLTYREGVAGNLFYYTEYIPQYAWQLQEGDSTVCGYPCQKAIASFRGRVWTVWYATDIPYVDGPWKLCGLPGLILKADDAKGDFCFTAFKIAKGTQGTFSMSVDKATKVKPEELEQEVADYMKNPLEKITGGRLKVENSDALGFLAIKPKTPCRLEIFAKRK